MLKNSSFKLSLTIALFYFFYFAMVGVYVIFMPKVLKDLGYSPVEIGAIYTSAPLMRFILPFIFKKYIPLTNRVFLVSLIATFLITILFFITIKSFYLHLFINLIFGGAMGAVLPFVETIALKYIGKEKYGKVRLWGSVGFSLVAFILAKFLDSYIVALIFLVVTAFFIMIFGLFLAPINSDNPKEQEDNKNFSLSKYWAFWVSLFLFQLSFGGFYNFFTIYETNHGISLDYVSYLWIFGVVCEIIMLIFQGPLLKSFNLLSLINLTLLLTTIRWVIVALFPQNLLLIAFSQALHAFSFALNYSAVIAYVYTLYPQKKLAQQFLLGIGFGLGGAVGAFISGIVFKYSQSGLFIFEAFMAFLSFIFLLIHQKRKEKV